MFKRTCLLLVGALIVLLPGSILRAQDIEPNSEGEFIRSMGIPSRYEFSLSPMFVIDREDDETKYGGQLAGSLYRHILSPLYGIGITGEGYVEDVESKDVDGGLRLLGGVKLLFLDAGVDYSFRDESADFILSAALPLKRGGLFGRGGNLRIDWLPARDHSFNIGFSIPLGQPYKGKTRTKHDRVRLPTAPDGKPQSPGKVMSSELRSTMDQLRHAASWINGYTTPFIDHDSLDDVKETPGFLQKVRLAKTHLNLKDDLYPEGHTFESEIFMYHRKLLRAFELCVSNGEPPSAYHRDEVGRIADKAREILLEEVIMPYNRLLGLGKKNDSLLGYAAKATTRFTAWLDSSTRLSPDQRAAVQSVFVRLMDIIEEQRRSRKSVWKESELVWIPLQYGLQPHQYDTREAMHTILEKVVEKPFSDANQVYYVINEQFQLEVARMILQTEDYHVLWIHDYRGVNAAGKPDSVSFRQTVDVYFAALTKKVREYDATRVFPVYIILLDQFFFESNGRFWIELLQNPLDYKLRLPSEYREWAERIEAAQNELRTAVAESKLLQEQTGKYGRKWLKNKIKVHVSITNPSDYSFRSAHLVPYFPFAPDNLMRDHRKISFYDVTEKDPGKGEALYSGMGIGEQYVGQTWDDRALLVRGPVLLSLKNEARRVLLQQGFKELDIPAPLRKQPLPSNYEDMVESLRKQGWRTSAMDVHNQTGFRSKLLNSLKAALYTLMPRGSIILVPDGYWNTPFWGGMLAGAALRGCRVIIITPSPENATFSDAFPLLSRSQELFSRLILIQKELKNELDAAGGMLKTGIYAQESDLGAIEVAEEFFEGIRNAPFLKEIFPFQPEAYSAIENIVQTLKSEGYQPRYLAEDVEKRKPKLHMKINVLVSGNVQGLLATPGWDEIFRAYFRYLAKSRAREERYIDVKDVPEELREAMDRTLERFWTSLPEEEQRIAMAFLLIGSQNHNYRSFIMDGEVACVVSGVDSLEALVDFFFMAGTSIWIEDLEALEKVFPAQKGWNRWIGRYMMKAM